MSDSLWCHGLYNPWNYPGQNTGVGSLSLLQGIFPTQRSNPGLPHCRQILNQLSHKGSPRILEGVAFPFSSGSSSSRNPTRVSCIACGFFTSWATGKLINTVTLKIGHNDKKFENLVQMTVSPRARMLNRHSFTHSHSYKEKESKKYPEQYAHK